MKDSTDTHAGLQGGVRTHVASTWVKRVRSGQREQHRGPASTMTWFTLWRHHRLATSSTTTGSDTSSSSVSWASHAALALVS